MMDIGGTDVEIRCAVGVEKALSVAARAILGVWPHGVIEDAETTEFLRVGDLIGGHRTEVFVFKNHSAWGSWTQSGWTVGNSKQMIHLLSHADGVLTCVVEDPEDSELGRILGVVREAVG